MSTIAAIGTATGSSGINIIRISGKDSLNIINKIFSNKDKLCPNEIHYGKIIYNGENVDNVLVSYFKAPNSFTGEDIVEINCHGGTYIAKNILEIVLKCGARLAGPGEFTKRAFLNGKMDLSEAEATIDLINSKTNLEARIASSQMSGKLKDDIVSIRSKMIDILAHIDVNVDYPEYDYEQLSNDNISIFLEEEINRLKKLLSSYEEGKVIKEGVNVAILGRPNAGKSSLLNNLAQEDRAIVTDIEGTTRDVISETVNIGDLILNIFDTAGIRESKDEIEKIGIEKSFKILDKVDLVLYIIDPGKEIDEEEKNILSKIENKGLKIIYLINKMDKYEKTIFDTILNEINQNEEKEVILISAKENLGIEELKNRIKQMFLKDFLNNTSENVIVNSRHKDLIQKSLDMLFKAKEEINNSVPIDMVSISIKESARLLGQIIGEDIDLDVAKRVFDKFCIGK
ncbi:MAG: tRNA uridine-5-carboxymethylaminomethyl(34) synthesis GTPase MnmE [Clostridia bacterium]|nr:tRNA uridine-5-carboxymethylaminomethyl(34) synthesis GTPase MnmE [Clostridia bacterium]